MAKGSKLGVSLTSLSLQAKWAGWPTARASDNNNKNTRTLDGALSEMRRKGTPQDLHSAALMTQIGFGAETNGGGLLNAEHSRWLLRIPAAWAPCVDMAMRSISKRR